MKKLLFLLLVPIMLYSADKEPKKFKVTFIITYNELTLEQAAEKEKEFNKFNSNNLEIKLESITGDSLIPDWSKFRLGGTKPFVIDTTYLYSPNHPKLQINNSDNEHDMKIEKLMDYYIIDKMF